MDTSDAEPTERFISACERIRRALEGQYASSFTGLGAAWRTALDKNNSVVRRHKTPLEALTHLRNAIQHSAYRGGRPIAVPRIDAVEAIEAIADQIENAPPISRHMVRNPKALSISTPLAEASESVIRDGLSQLPVYDQGRYLGLFTTNALARWLSDSLQRNAGDLIEADSKVGDILPFTEPYESAHFVKPTASAYRVCDMLSNDSAPLAVLVTTDGTQAGDLQGIVTRFDVPSILRAVTTVFP